MLKQFANEHKFYLIRNEMIRYTASYMDNYYFKPWTRAPPYLVGIWTGWFLHRIKETKLRVPQVNPLRTHLISGKVD